MLWRSKRVAALQSFYSCKTVAPAYSHPQCARDLRRRETCSVTRQHSASPPTSPPTPSSSPPGWSRSTSCWSRQQRSGWTITVLTVETLDWTIHRSIPARRSTLVLMGLSLSSSTLLTHSKFFLLHFHCTQVYVVSIATFIVNFP